MEEDLDRPEFTYSVDESKILTSTILETITARITLICPDGNHWQYQIEFPYAMLIFLKSEDQYPWLTMPVVYGTVKYDSDTAASGAAQDKALEVVKDYENWLAGRPYKYSYEFRVPFKSPDRRF